MSNDYSWWNVLQDKQASFLEKNQALEKFEAFFEPITQALQIEYYGENVGLGAGKTAYRLVVRQHEWAGQNSFMWGLRVCDALPNAQWRAAWRITGTSRLRKEAIITALPGFLLNYYQLAEKFGKSKENEGKTLINLLEGKFK
jgi:hypothetical protein